MDNTVLSYTSTKYIHESNKFLSDLKAIRLQNDPGLRAVYTYITLQNGPCLRTVIPASACRMVQVSKPCRHIDLTMHAYATLINSDF